MICLCILDYMLRYSRELLRYCGEIFRLGRKQFLWLGRTALVVPIHQQEAKHKPVKYFFLQTTLKFFWNNNICKILFAPLNLFLSKFNAAKLCDGMKKNHQSSNIQKTGQKLLILWMRAQTMRCYIFSESQNQQLEQLEHLEPTASQKYS